MFLTYNKRTQSNKDKFSKTWVSTQRERESNGQGICHKLYGVCSSALVVVLS